MTGIYRRRSSADGDTDNPDMCLTPFEELPVI